MAMNEPVGQKPLAPRLKRLAMHVGLWVVGLVMLYPLLWMLASSFKPEQEIFSNPGLWPETFTLDNYRYGWTALRIPFSQFFRNSFIVTGFSIVGNLLACSVTAYAFARLKF